LGSWILRVYGTLDTAAVSIWDVAELVEALVDADAERGRGADARVREGMEPETYGLLQSMGSDRGR
jgi:hypothetical protein